MTLKIWEWVGPLVFFKIIIYIYITFLSTIIGCSFICFHPHVFTQPYKINTKFQKKLFQNNKKSVTRKGVSSQWLFSFYCRMKLIFFLPFKTRGSRTLKNLTCFCKKHAIQYQILAKETLHLI